LHVDDRGERITNVSEFDRRVGRNEAMLREVNESIERGRWPGDDSVPFRFRCECASLDCNETIMLTRSEYEHVRHDGRRFAILAGHEAPPFESVVETHEGYVVVEKHDEAGEVAEDLDPRG
jgi:hypothetical protein